MVLAYVDMCSKRGGHKLKLRDEDAKNGSPNGFTEQAMNSHQLNIRLQTRTKIMAFHSGMKVSAGNRKSSV